MKMGDHIGPIVDLLYDLNGSNAEANLKLLALVLAEIMAIAGTTGFEVSVGELKIAVEISQETP